MAWYYEALKQENFCAIQMQWVNYLTRRGLKGHDHAEAIAKAKVNIYEILTSELFNTLFFSKFWKSLELILAIRNKQLDWNCGDANSKADGVGEVEYVYEQVVGNQVGHNRYAEFSRYFYIRQTRQRPWYSNKRI